MAPPSSAPSEDALLRTVAADGSVGLRALAATGVVREAARRHATTPTATAALGRTLMAALLLGAGAKSEETVQLRLRGDGPLRFALAIADGEARVRGYVGAPEAERPSRDGKLDVGGALGRGNLAVVRHHPSWREPYTGIVDLVSGEVGEDVAAYLTKSEQTPSAVALGVFVGSDGGVEAAGGYLVQSLPDAPEEALERLEANVRGAPTPSQMLRAGGGAEGFLETLTAGLGARPAERRAPRFFCGCDEERVARAVALLGRSEVRELCDAGEPVEVRCEFCATVHHVAPERARAYIPDA